jgi:outer membrane protein, heavy metal efflux system
VRKTALWLLLSLPALGQAVKLDDLVEEALRRNPEILAAQKKYEAARQRPAQERSLPDPMFSAGWNSSGNPLPFAGVGSEPVANVGVMASQELPGPGKLRLRGLVAAKEADAEAQQFRAVQLNVVARVKFAYFRLHHAWIMTDIYQRNLEMLRSLLRITEARYSVAKAPQADVFKAQTQMTVMETRLIQVQRDIKARSAELDSLTGRPGGGIYGLPEDPREAHDFTLEQLLARAREEAPVLARDQKMIERAGTALNLARKNNLPDVTINGGYYYMGSMPPMYMIRADVKVPLRFGKTRAEVAERSYEVSEARHAYTSTAQSLEYRIRDDYATIESAQKLMDLYSKVVIPQAKLAIESSLAAYQTGTTDFLSVLMNQLAVFEYEMAYHEQMQEHHMALARLEEMTGVQLIQ